MTIIAPEDFLLSYSRTKFDNSNVPNLWKRLKNLLKRNEPPSKTFTPTPEDLFYYVSEDTGQLTNTSSALLPKSKHLTL